MCHEKMANLLRKNKNYLATYYFYLGVKYQKGKMSVLRDNTQNYSYGLGIHDKAY
jgi:hypothetical protein